MSHCGISCLYSFICLYYLINDTHHILFCTNGESTIKRNQRFNICLIHLSIWMCLGKVNNFAPNPSKQGHILWDEHPAFIKDGDETLTFFLIEGHGRYFSFEVQNFEYSIPLWVKKCMDEYSDNRNSNELRVNDKDYYSKIEKSIKQVESGEDAINFLPSPSIPVIVLSDDDSTLLK